MTLSLSKLTIAVALSFSMCSSSILFAGTFREINGVVSMEAENYSSQVGYSERSLSSASGGKTMQVGSSGELKFDIDFSTSGKWYVWVRALAKDHLNNGLHINLDGVRQRAPAGHLYAGSSDIYLYKSPTTLFWTPEWQGPGSGERLGPVAIENVTPGLHTFSIFKRKVEQPLIDKIVLTKSSTPPSGFGPPETHPIPEPSSAALLTMATLTLIAKRRRSSRASKPTRVRDAEVIDRGSVE